jgi:hypothetical protein
MVGIHIIPRETTNRKTTRKEKKKVMMKIGIVVRMRMGILMSE